MKKLPNLFVSNVNKAINNNMNQCILKRVEEDKKIKNENTKEIENTLDKIFYILGHPTTIPVEIALENGRILKTRLKRREKNFIYTINNQEIEIKEIKMIEIKKN